MSRHTILTCLIFSAIGYFGQIKNDSMDAIRKKEQEELLEKLKKQTALDFKNSVNVIGIIDDGVFAFEPEFKTSVILCRILKADSIYENTTVIIVVQGGNTPVLKKGHTYKMSVIPYKHIGWRDVVWTRYKDSGYKKLYLIDSHGAIKDVTDY